MPSRADKALKPVSMENSLEPRYLLIDNCMHAVGKHYVEQYERGIAYMSGP